eukprot:4765675-Alexandrium_andersonii.AAC.1
MCAPACKHNSVPDASNADMHSSKRIKTRGMHNSLCNPVPDKSSTNNSIVPSTVSEPVSYTHLRAHETSAHL